MSLMECANLEKEYVVYSDFVIYGTGFIFSRNHLGYEALKNFYFCK